MKHAIVLAHPSRKSFNAEIARTYREVVERLGDETILRDLYAMRFDPCLKAAEIPGPKAQLGGHARLGSTAYRGAEVAVVFPHRA
ncbi:NAD(P)H-dependent oxidoreductase [Phenylobacterium sp.]|uniref:NAD(P)H-dependent oxidoreductase n=1 Tax=Phenylobacterium sp. TaxID=1871053 RepID=UPI0025E0735D|nr:NAD(P)H-dependent oxidoreductase [Phenylobacterium sp.]